MRLVSAPGLGPDAGGMGLGLGGALLLGGSLYRGLGGLFRFVVRLVSLVVLCGLSMLGCRILRLGLLLRRSRGRRILRPFS